MAKWDDFEKACTHYLNDTYGEYASFELQGGSDSANPDIRVETKRGKKFYLEAKMCPAQCGQFVLLPNEEKKFVYSSTHEKDEYSEKISDYMNEHFDEYCDAGGSGKTIDLDSEIFYEWVKKHYRDKNVKFFITGKDDFVIFPVDVCDEYFDISAKYRMKRSGTSNPSKNNQAEIIKILDALHTACGAEYILHYGNSKEKTYIDTDLDLANKYMQGEEYEYFFRRENNKRFYIKRCSNTQNSNVIFSVKLKRKKIYKEEYIPVFLKELNK